MALPYQTATSGQRAIDDVRRMLSKFGCQKFAAGEDFAKGEIFIQFEHRGRMIHVVASAKGYASAMLKDSPYSHRMRCSEVEYERKCLAQGQTAVYSILRDWVKGQVTAIECGIISFDAAFLGQMVLPDGRTVMERLSADKLLPAPEESK